MRYALVALLGLLLGAAAGGAVIYYNPFTQASPPSADSADRALHYDLPGEVLGFTVGDGVLPPGTPRHDDVFWEETIDRTALLSQRPDALAGLWHGADACRRRVNA